MLDVVQCLLRLLAVPSVSGREAALAGEVAQLLRATFPDADVELQDLGDGGANVFMRQGEPIVLLTTHLDTVPGAIRPRSDAISVHGRGACDAKGQIAAQICALQRAQSRGVRDLGCFFVAGEEIDSRGALAALTHPFVCGAAVVNGEPTRLRFVARSWGIVELELRTHGRAAHSSTSMGVAATHGLVRDLAALLELEHDGRRVNIGVVSGGAASNVTAPDARALVGIRFREDLPALLDDLRATVQCSEVALRQVIEPLQLHVPPGASAATEVTFASDAACYAWRFERIFEFGPGDIEHAHSRHEQVAIADLHAAVEILAGLLEAGA